MTETDVQRVEALIELASPEHAAAIAVAAIRRIGDHGREGGEAFGKIAREILEGADSDIYFDEGCAQIDEHLAR
jgi:hypothetical protein